MEGGSTSGAERVERQLSVRRLMLVFSVVVSLLASSNLILSHLANSTSTGGRGPWFAPYVDVTFTPTFAFQDPNYNPVPRAVLAFVVSDPDHSCSPSWGGAYTLDEASASLDLDRRLSHMRQNAGVPMVSFGGLNNVELAVACKSQQDLANAYQSVVQRYHTSVVDFDIEGTAVTDTASNQRRAAAIRTLQQQVASKGGKLAVWLTLPVAPTGLDSAAQSLVADTIGAGVDLAGVNVMTMDFGASAAGRSLLDAVKSAISSTHDELMSIFAAKGLKLSPSAAWQRLGATVMIGQNDEPREVLTTGDANRFTSFAQQVGLGRVSMWSINRDSQCGNGYAVVGVLSNSCSGTPQKQLEFTHIFSQLNGVPANSPALATMPSVNPVTVDDPSKSPYPIWLPGQMYWAGYKVVWHGSVYQAKWFSQGQPPDTPVQHPWDSAWLLVGPVLPGDHPAPVPTVSPGTYPNWSATATYRPGSRVLLNGLPYQAKRFTLGDSPDVEMPDPSLSPWKPLFTLPGEPQQPGG